MFLFGRGKVRGFEMRDAPEAYAMHSNYTRRQQLAQQRRAQLVQVSSNVNVKNNYYENLRYDTIQQK